MSKYLFIETRDPFERQDTVKLYGLINELSTKGHDVALFLTQNGVLATRKEAKVPLLPVILKEKNVAVYADDYSLEERGISTSDLVENIQVSGADTLVDLTMETGRKPVWY